MNPIEIEAALSELVTATFDPETFPWDFLRAFGNNETTIKRLQSGNQNHSDLGGVLQRNNLHLLIAEPAELSDAFARLRESPQNARRKVRIALATDGDWVEAIDLRSDTRISCALARLPDHFADLLPLAGIETVAQIREHSLDIRATRSLNRLYSQIIRDNPEWGTPAKSHAMNHLMARLIFAFFAEDTDIFLGRNTFTQTLTTYSTDQGTEIREILDTLFRVMNTPGDTRRDFPTWAVNFPYVNGGLFAEDLELPTFTRAARSHLLELGALDWKDINPDIFGAMIQAIAEPDERSEAGLHYTSVPNILKVLNPLFLDDLRATLERAQSSPKALRDLRKRLSKIRVFDPACGSGNFLVIAYKELRKIEAEINTRLNEPHARTGLSPTNFRGIEIRPFAVEIARLSLIITKFQCDSLYYGQKEAVNELLPLEHDNWIVEGNALRLDWHAICPPTGDARTIRHARHDLFEDTPADQQAYAFDNEGGEVYICGNPPYLGTAWQSKEQKADMAHVFEGKTRRFASLDYVAAWLMRAAEYGAADIALVTTNSICQGQQVAPLWPPIFERGMAIHFAIRSFKWANLAAHNAGVTVVVIGLSPKPPKTRTLYDVSEDGSLLATQSTHINPYLVSGPNHIVAPQKTPISEVHDMDRGNGPVDGGHLLLPHDEKTELLAEMRRLDIPAEHLIRRVYGSREFIHDEERYCLWIGDDDLALATQVPSIQKRIEQVRGSRAASRKAQTRELASVPHRFAEVRQRGDEAIIAIPRVSSEHRPYLPVGLLPPGTIVTDRLFALFDAPLWNLALLASRLHLVWITTVCGQLETRFSYSNTLGWNTFPLPRLTSDQKAQLTEAAEELLLIRERHFPKTLAALYDDAQMPADLREAHHRNDLLVEQIFMGRAARHDTDRLEQLFSRYAKLTQKGAA